jgi:hypothetical protein
LRRDDDPCSQSLQIVPSQSVTEGPLDLPHPPGSKRPDAFDQAMAGHDVNIVEVGHRAARESLSNSERYFFRNVADGRGDLDHDDPIEIFIGAVA